MSKKPSVSTFQDEWLSHEEYSKWINKTIKPTEARCIQKPLIFLVWEWLP